MARRIVGGLGSTWQNPPASFYRTNREATTAAESVSQIFLGVRLQCARCHNHPFDAWTQDDYYGLAAFFSNIARKQLNNVGRTAWTYTRSTATRLFTSGPPGFHPAADRHALATEISGRAQGGSSRRRIRKCAGAAGRLADARQPQFSRNLANRVWFHLLGRGIVEPVDDFRDSNPPSNPALLDAVTAYFEAHGMRLEPLVAEIMKSQTYQ